MYYIFRLAFYDNNFIDNKYYNNEIKIWYFKHIIISNYYKFSSLLACNIETCRKKGVKKYYIKHCYLN